MPFSSLRAMFSDMASFISDSDWMPWNWRYDPEWMWLMQGESPLLEHAEYEFIAQVRYLIIKEAKTLPKVNHDQHLKEKLSVMKNNFEEIVSCLKERSLLKGYFVKNYSSWRFVRDTSIKQLKNIAKTLNENSQASAASRGVGSSVSLVGGLMCLVPGIGALRMAGGVLVGIGSLAATAVSLLEYSVLRKKIKEAEDIMLQDRVYSEKLWDWMNDISYMQEAYDAIKNIDENRKLERIAKDLFASFKEKITLEDLKIIIGNIVFSAKFSSGITTNFADVIAILIAIYMLHDRYQPLFILASETYECKRILSTACNVVATAAKMTSVVNASKSSKLTNFQKSRLAIGIALDIIILIQASKDMASVCKESKEIAKVAEKLKEEAEIFEKVYDRVQRL